MSGRWRVGCAGCLLVILLGSLTLGGCVARFFQSTHREPELPIRQLLHKQLEAFPQDWTLSDLQIQTDSDFTWAYWAVTANYNYKMGLDFAGEEIHVFRNAFVAKAIPHPSPSSLSAGKGYIPQGWTYRPPHADRFEFGCSGGDGISRPEGCSLILRYEEYIIVFGTPVGSHMTLDDLRRILEVIDREMATYLQNSTLRPGPREVPLLLDE